LNYPMAYWIYIQTQAQKNNFIKSINLVGNTYLCNLNHDDIDHRHY